MTPDRRPSIQDLESALGTALEPPLVRLCALTARPAPRSQDSKSRCRVPHAMLSPYPPRWLLGLLYRQPKQGRSLVQDAATVGSQDRDFQRPDAMLGSGQALRYCSGFRFFLKNQHFSQYKDKNPT